MREPIKILLDRMETHPHEFIEKYSHDIDDERETLFSPKSKWEKLVEHYKQFMTNEEKKILLEKLSDLNMSTFKENFTKQLLADEKEQEEQFTKDKAIELMKVLAQKQQEAEHEKQLHISKLQWDAMQEAVKGAK